ncbi:hypothetical protein EVAR_64938_1 [Eumeta japonica]|uniref:Uncharacterized protein n=1 Tax=Eumeta variegata TaxID=151549 RepID=A0A4C1ZC12_EUMVA|nr:hypothetical protein EVAR_64938_1 [Eumeta japonica]
MVTVKVQSMRRDEIPVQGVRGDFLKRFISRKGDRKVIESCESKPDVIATAEKGTSKWLGRLEGMSEDVKNLKIYATGPDRARCPHTAHSSQAQRHRRVRSGRRAARGGGRRHNTRGAGVPRERYTRRPPAEDGAGENQASPSVYGTEREVYA